MLLVLEVLLAARGVYYYLCRQFTNIYISKVYALFDRKRSVGIFLTLMLIFKTAAVVALDIMSVLMIEFDDGCLVASIPWTLICVRCVASLKYLHSVHSLPSPKLQCDWPYCAVNNMGNDSIQTRQSSRSERMAKHSSAIARYKRRLLGICLFGR